MSGDNPFDEDIEVEAIDAFQLLEAIRNNARPSWSSEIDRLCEKAARHGWSIDTLAAAINRELGASAGPGVAMMLLRRFAGGPPPRKREKPQGAEPSIIGHAPCADATHDARCQVCYCQRGSVEHMIPLPMPEWFTDEWRARFRGWGVIPDA